MINCDCEFNDDIEMKVHRFDCPFIKELVGTQLIITEDELPEVFDEDNME